MEFDAFAFCTGFNQNMCECVVVFCLTHLDIFHHSWNICWNFPKKKWLNKTKAKLFKCLEAKFNNNFRLPILRMTHNSGVSLNKFFCSAKRNLLFDQIYNSRTRRQRITIFYMLYFTQKDIGKALDFGAIMRLLIANTCDVRCADVIWNHLFTALKWKWVSAFDWARSMDTRTNAYQGFYAVFHLYKNTSKSISSQRANNNTICLKEQFRDSTSDVGRHCHCLHDIINALRFVWWLKDAGKKKPQNEKLNREMARQSSSRM